MDLAFDDVWLVAGLNRGQGHFSNFLVPPMYFIMQKVYFSRLMWAYIGLIMLAVYTVPYLVQVSLILIGQPGLGHFYRYQPLLSISWRTMQIVRQRRRKMTNTTPTALSAIHIYQCTNYTPLVSSGNDKNKQLTSLSHCKLALTKINTLFAPWNHLSPETSRVPYLSLVL